MTTIDVRAFAAAAESFALKVDSACLPGLLRRSLVVPPGCAALLRDADGREVLLEAGAEQGGTFSGVLVRRGEVAVPFQVAGLASKEGAPATAGLEVVLRGPARAIEMRALETALLGDRASAGVADLRDRLLPSVRTALALFVASKSAEDLCTLDHRAELERRLLDELRPACFPAGLDAREVRHPSFFCEEFEARRRRELEAEVREEELRRAERLQQFQARIAKNEILKKQEVEELAKVLQYQGVLKEISLKNDLDRKRKEEELRRFEGLRQRLGQDEVKALIFLLEDERLKADLIRELCERDMTEEQLRAKRGGEAERKLEARIEELTRRLNEALGVRERRLAERGTRTRRILGALGKNVHAFDPGTNVAREAPKEVYDLERGGLGYVRSVRVAVTRDGPAILIGAQRGVYMVREGDPRDVRELRFPREPHGQGGVNAAGYFDGHIYATHSELGLWRWDQYMRVPEQLHGALTARNESTRGATVTADGKLFFASGVDVYRADLVRPQGDAIAYRGRDEPITTFAVTPDELLAGTRGGRILRWSLSDPASPRELNVRKAEPIYMLKVAELCGEDHALVGAKDHGMTAVSLADGRAFDYRAREQIRWVDGGSDFVCGVSRSGYSIHVWEAGRLDEAAFELRVPDRLQDLFAQKERVEPAGRAT